MLHRSRLFTVEDVDQHAGGGARWWGARVVAAVARQRPGDQQFAGAGLLLGDDADPTALGVVDDVGAVVPVDETRWVGGLEDDARQVDVASALDEQLGIADDLCLWNCKIR